MADAQISVAGTAAVPISYTVPNAVEEALLCVNATIDGTGASGQFYATVEIVSDGGVVVARCPCFTAIAPGGAAEISWFRVREALTESAPASPYEAVILARPTLRLYWKMDELGGIAAFDSSGNGFTGNYATTGMSIGDPPLADGTSFTFSSSGFFGPTWDGGPACAVQIASTNFPPVNGNDMSMELWVKTTQAGGANAYFAAVSGLASHTLPLAFLRLGAGGTAVWTLWDNVPAQHDLNGVTVINDGVRHQLGCTYDGATMNLYVDGALDATAAVAFTLNTIPAASIGAINVNGRPIAAGFWESGYTGVADEFSYYTGVLTAADYAASWAARQ